MTHLSLDIDESGLHPRQIPSSASPPRTRSLSTASSSPSTTRPPARQRFSVEGHTVYLSFAEPTSLRPPGRGRLARSGAGARGRALPQGAGRDVRGHAGLSPSLSRTRFSPQRSPCSRWPHARHRGIPWRGTSRRARRKDARGGGRGSAPLFWLHVLPDTAIAVSCFACGHPRGARAEARGRPHRPREPGAARRGRVRRHDRAALPGGRVDAVVAGAHGGRRAARGGGGRGGQRRAEPPVAPPARGGAGPRAKLAHVRGLKLEAAHRELDAAVAGAKGRETQLFASVSHELRTPLALILGPTERLLAGPGSPPEQRADLEVVARNARTLAQARRRSALRRQARGGRLTARTPRSTSPISSAPRPRTSTASRPTGTSPTPSTPRAPIPAEVDASKLQRALLNLLSNAFKYTPIGGRVRCAARAHGEDRVVIEVADSGPGVPPPRGRRVRALPRAPAAAPRGASEGRASACHCQGLRRADAGTVEIGDAPEGGALLRVELPAAPRRARWSPPSRTRR